MNNTMKRRLYAAPSAEIICLAPADVIATAGPNWKWNPTTNANNKWGTNSWGVTFGIASATGIAEWLDDNDENPELK